MLNQVNDGIRRASRLMTIRHPNAVDVSVYRKTVVRDEDDDPDNPVTIGGAGVLSIRDEVDYTIELLGAGRMMFLGRLDGSSHSAFGILNWSGDEIHAYIEPLIEGEFEVKKYDRVYWHLIDNFIEYEVKDVLSPSQFPDSRLNVYVLQPLEQSGNPEDWKD